MAKPKVKVEQTLKGRSLRSFRLVQDVKNRSMNRYQIRPRQEGIEMPKSLNEVRNFIYTFSVMIEDANTVIPAKFLKDLNRYNLKLGRFLGDTNAITNTVMRSIRGHESSGVGKRALRRVGGKASGAVIGLIPSGQNVATEAIFRGIRSPLGANLTRWQSKFINNFNTPSASSALAANFTKLAKRGELSADTIIEYIAKKMKENTPQDTNALYNSVKVRKGRKPGRQLVSIGNIKPMPDPTVPYPHIIEFGINKGFNKGVDPRILTMFPTPRRFNYLRNVTGARPEGDTYFGGFYNNDNRGPYERSNNMPRKGGNYRKGAMMRTALFKIVQDSVKYGTFSVARPANKRNPFKAYVWDTADGGDWSWILKGRYSMKDNPVPF